MSRIFILCSVLFLLQPLAVLAASPVFDQAVQQYKSRRYSQALPGFQAELKRNPSDALTHYYMALCYQGMNQMALAKQQYEWVASSNNAQLRGYASAGLASLSKFPTSYASSASTAPIGRPSPSAQITTGAPKISGRLKVIEFYTDW